MSSCTFTESRNLKLVIDSSMIVLILKLSIKFIKIQLKLNLLPKMYMNNRIQKIIKKNFFLFLKFISRQTLINTSFWPIFCIHFVTRFAQFLLQYSVDTMMTQPQMSHSTSITEKTASCPNDLFLKDYEFNPGFQVTASQYISGDAFICLGSEDGSIRVFSASSRNIPYVLTFEDKSPVTCISSPQETSGIKNSLLATHTGGNLEFWHATSNKILFSKNYERPLQCCEVSGNGQWYTIGTQNGEMYLGHLNKGNPKTLETGHLGSHNNRVFCLKWHPEDENLFLSGGWDKTVFFWDVRTKASVKKIYGYYIGGKAIDLKDNELLLGNNENENQLRIYDLKKDSVRVIKYEHYSEGSLHSQTGINSCFFGKGDCEIVALTSRNEIRTYIEGSCVSVFQHEDEGVKGYSMSSGSESRKIVTTWSNGDVKILSY